MPLSEEQIAFAKNYNQRARQLFWRNFVPQDSPLWNLHEQDELEWILDFQKKYHLLEDGCFGTSCKIALTALSLGGIGGFILGNQEIQCENTIVARLFKPSDQTNYCAPKCAVLLAAIELDSLVRDRLQAKEMKRAHFSIDSSAGNAEKSLIIQWADPLTPINKQFQTKHFPSDKPTIGIELETVINLYKRDADERKWNKRRPLVSAPIAGKNRRSGVLYSGQINALNALIDILEKYAHIPRRFPTQPTQPTQPAQNDAFDTYPHTPDHWNSWSGYLAHFHYDPENIEPGAGLIPFLPTLFPNKTINPEKTEEPNTIPIYSNNSNSIQENEISIKENIDSLKISEEATKTLANQKTILQEKLSTEENTELSKNKPQSPIKNTENLCKIPIPKTLPQPNSKTASPPFSPIITNFPPFDYFNVKKSTHLSNTSKVERMLSKFSLNLDKEH